MLARLLIAAALVGAAATTAFAECSWLMWSQKQDQPNPASAWFRNGVYPSYSACWSRIYELSKIPQKNSLRDWIDWTNHRGRYAKAETVTDAGAHIIVVDDGVEMYSAPGRVTSVRCLPDTVDPRGPKGR
jgi:hypothetical protein